MPLLNADAAMGAGAAMGATAALRFDHRAQAREHRRKMKAREDNRLALEIATAGDDNAVRASERAWMPILPDRGWDPIRRVIGEPK